MFANRFTALVDACTLASALKRNLLLTLAEAEFFRIRWSKEILDETERALAGIHARPGLADAAERARRARGAMERAFEDAVVADYVALPRLGDDLPDPADAHVLAAAAKTRAHVIVTENLRHFPQATLAALGIEARAADAFIADTVALAPGAAVAAIRRMRERLNNPAQTAAALLVDMEADGLIEAADVLRPHVDSL